MINYKLNYLFNSYFIKKIIRKKLEKNYIRFIKDIIIKYELYNKLFLFL